MTQKPLLEQILNKMFDELEGLEQFDPATIERLKDLVQTGGLARPDRLTEGIKGGGAAQP